MDTREILSLTAIIVCVGIFIFRRVRKKKLANIEKKLAEKHGAEVRRRSIEAIKRRTIGGENLIDYGTYKLSKTERVKYTLLAASIIFCVGIIFYDSIIVSSIAACLGIIYPKFKRKDLIKMRKDELALQFKEAISSLASSLAAGQSIENAFRETQKDLKLLYPDNDTCILKELNLINRRVENGEIIERAIDDFAKRSDVDDIRNFSDVFITCKRTGGDLVEVIKRTADIITDKIEIQQDIRVLVSQKKFESKIMAVAPVGITVMLKVTSPDFVAPLYEFGTLGPIVMTVALACIICGLLISQKIMDIEV
ncbi:pilus assembly protein TadB [Agaribacter marinus]|uniref:Type II secretion system F family protein n=1 Tax=Virgibacillus salarius TaxID=447199 RepID=A0A941DVX0_9BACI|nr:type II secretion system F family protein [Virgibacillus salarius]MBR7796406.1 type II secretion system F family protein [Virgibacillus salarius]NAZ09115.1 pilus assembly protein TadB [Agaribacter marinus]WBX80598.1 type II secretion system F family protein [Virgibacillus salarius]